MKLSLQKGDKTPVYMQIIEGVESHLERGTLKIDEQIPSINQIAKQNKIAKETVVKAFKIMQERGILRAVHGKGYFVSSTEVETKKRVFLLLDALTPYKERLYNSIKNTFGKEAYVDVYFHHYNAKIFQKLVEEAEGNYTSYIVLPFECSNCARVIQLLPPEKTLLIDRKPKILTQEINGVYQDFEGDVHNALTQLSENIQKYSTLNLVFRNTATRVPTSLKHGFENYCKTYGVNYDVLKTLENHAIQKGESFLVIDDEDLVLLVEHANREGWKLGRDLGILSYNETSLKKVVAGGISVISTDFDQMGKSIAQMSMDGKPSLIANPSRVIHRNSF